MIRAREGFVVLLLLSREREAGGRGGRERVISLNKNQKHNFCNLFFSLRTTIINKEGEEGEEKERGETKAVERVRV